MKTQTMTKSMIFTSIILLIGGTLAFAQGGWGGGGGPLGGDCPGRGYNADNRNLTEEEAARVEAAREQFYTDTEELRTKIREIRTEMRDEMAKDDPDSTKVLDLQKALSDVRAAFDQERAKHRLEMRKLLPEKFQGCQRGSGYGRGHGRGGGDCWR